MNRRLWILVFAAALLAVPGVATGAAAKPVLDTLRRVEEDVMMSRFFAQGEDEEAYPQRRVLQSGGHISYGALAESKAACYGPCPARGQPYTGRGCQQIYQCRG